MNLADSKIYGTLLEVCKPFGVDPSASIEAEQFFKNLLQNYQKELAGSEFREWLTQRVAENFQTLNKRPVWIQSSDWVFVDGCPALFLSQTELLTNQNPQLAQLFHDDVTFYLFLGQDGTPIVKMQQF